MKNVRTYIHPRFAPFCLTIFFALSMCRSNVHAADICLYVSPAGNDSNPGTADRPLATIDKARQQVRTLKPTAQSPITVWLKPGTYYLGKTLAFDPDDSGTKAAPITYQAEKEGTVTISGGVRLQCSWKPYKDGIFVCDVPEAKGGKLNFSELFVNGKRQIRARWPNGDSRIPQPTGYAFVKAMEHVRQYKELELDSVPALNHKTRPVRPCKELEYDPAAFTKKKWSHPEEAILFSFVRTDFNAVPFWSALWRIRGIDYNRNSLLLGEGGHQQVFYPYMEVYNPAIYPRMPYFVENVFEELDSPGEWYCDSREGKLYYIPPVGMNMAEAVVEPALLQRIVEFKGTNEIPVRNITLRGMWIAHGASTYFKPYSSAGMGDTSICREGAVFIEGAEDIHIDRCSLEGNFGNACFVNCRARRVKITNCRVADVGESGVCFVGKDNYRADNRMVCPKCGFVNWWGWDDLSEDDMPVDCEVSNCLIRDFGVVGKHSPGIFVANALRVRMIHNSVFNGPRACININNSLYGGHVIEFNDVHDGVRETADHGPINVWGRDSHWCQHVNHRWYIMPDMKPHEAPEHSYGTWEEITKDARETSFIRYNRFSDTRLGYSPWPQHGICMDDGAANYQIYDNLGVGIGGKVYHGSFIHYHDNVFVNAGPGPLAVSNADVQVNFCKNINNVFIQNSSPEDVQRKFFANVRFGPSSDFPDWLLDKDRLVILLPFHPLKAGDTFRLLLLECQDPVEVRYTLDGTEPSATSPLYTNPVALQTPCTIKVRVFRSGKPEPVRAEKSIAFAQ